MDPFEFRIWLDQRPFRPIRLVLTDGRTFDIMHPELALVELTAVTIGMRDSTREALVADRMVMVSLGHIAQVEVLETAPPVR